MVALKGKRVELDLDALKQVCQACLQSIEEMEAPGAECEPTGPQTLHGGDQGAGHIYTQGDGAGMSQLQCCQREYP